MPAYMGAEMAELQDPWRSSVDEACSSDSDGSGVGVPTPDISRTARKRRYGVALLVCVGAVVVLFHLASSSHSSKVAMTRGKLDAETVVLKGGSDDEDEEPVVHEEKEKGCETAKSGTQCYRDVDFAMHEHIKHHPDWYVGLTEHSSFEEFQAHFAKETDEAGKARCPKPCGLAEAIAKSKARNEKNWGYTDSCHDTKGGEPCFSHVKYTKDQIVDHPDWYPGLNKKSSIHEIQHFLYRQRDGSGHRVCPLPCETDEDVSDVDDLGVDAEIDALLGEGDGEEKKDCEDAPEDSECYIQVKETMKQVKKHPSEYPGLTSESTVKQVQAYMYEERTSSGQRVCPKPCGKEFEEASMEEEENGCKNAVPGTTCFNDIQYAMKACGVHAEWYAGLSVNNTPIEFQAFLATQHDDSNKKKCPIPCNETAIKMVEELREIQGSCYTASESANPTCYKAVVWVATAGYKDPKLKKNYPGISPKSSFEEVQARLAKNKDKKSKCDHMPCPCHTAVPGEKCHDSVKWVLKTGIEKHPKWYKGLKNTSSFEEVQKHLHNDPAADKSACQLPCVAPQWPWPEDE